MNAEVFVDTNVFLYAIDEDPASAAKRLRAEEILLTEKWGWSVQVAAEFYVNATSIKRPFRLKPIDAAKLVDVWLALPTVKLTPELLRHAIQIHQQFLLSYWDAAILAAAKEMRCRVVYSEDLNAGQDYDGVKVINPFVI
jgi:predicted nucleic acid-binding protein